MRIARIEDLHCDAGWRHFSFLKITTDSGLVGWSEYQERFGTAGLTGTIHGVGDLLIGRDPRPVEAITAWLHGVIRQVPGGIAQQAIAAIENALVDIKAKSLGIAVHDLLGGPIRSRIPLYWSHCGYARVRWPDRVREWTGGTAIRTRGDIVRHAREIAAAGFKGLKTNPFRLDAEPPAVHMPGFNSSPGYPELNADPDLIAAVVDQMQAFREGGGPRMNLHLDLNFNYKTEGYIRLARALAGVDLAWLEIDSLDPASLATIRRAAPMPIASCESLFHRRQFRPFLEQQAVDVAIIDVTWNGILESMKIAALADTYEVNVAPHNFNGDLGTLMSAAFCAAVPNLRVMEIDIEDVPWKSALLTEPLRVEAGALLVPTGIGWGADIDEDVLRAHPPRGREPGAR